MKNNKENIPLISLNKYLSSAGVCSRRQAVEFIKLGLVKVNNIVVKTPYSRVNQDDSVKFKDKLVLVDEKLYILLNKPSDYVTTISDPKGRRTVIDLVKNITEKRVHPIGRLDRTTTGLILLTNDGSLTQKLAHPKNEVKKVYSVVLDKPLKIEHIQAIRGGLKLKDGIASVDKISFILGVKKNKIKVQLHSGKNRIVRRLFEHFEYKVLKLDRINYAGLTKRGLPLGRSRILTKTELYGLKMFGNVSAMQKNKRTIDARQARTRRTKNKRSKKIRR